MIGKLCTLIKEERCSVKVSRGLRGAWLSMQEALHTEHGPRAGNLHILGVEQTSSLRFTFSRVSKSAAPMSLEIVKKLCQEGQINEALNALDLSRQQGICITTNVCYEIVKACNNMKDLALGRKVHHCIIRAGLELDDFLGTHLINMFASCGSLREANEVFEQLPNPSEFTWIAIVSAHHKLGQNEQAIKLFHKMQQSNITPGEFVCVTVLKACASIMALEQGRLVHHHIIENGLEYDIVLGNALIDLYSKCGSLDDACRVFNKLTQRCVVTWTAMIAGFMQCGQGLDGLQLFQRMYQEGMKPNDVTFSTILKACSKMAALDQGKLIHHCVIEAGVEGNEFVGFSLIDMYSKCHSIAEAHRVFEILPGKLSVYTWGAMIGGFAQNEHGVETLQLIQDMQEEGIQPSTHIFVSGLKACSNVTAFNLGKLLHAHVVEVGFDASEFVLNTLIDMYASAECLDDAWAVFRKGPRPSLVRWNAMIEGYVKCGRSQEAFRLLLRMQEQGLTPDKATLLSILKACSITADFKQGKDIHSFLIRANHEDCDIIASTLIHMYAKCGSMKDARKVFDIAPKGDIVTWNAMLTAYVQYRHSQEAIHLFQKLSEFGIKQDKVTFITILKACAGMAALKLGKQIHLKTSESGFELDLSVGNAIIDMYAKCGSLEDATKMFNKMPQRDLVSWSTMVAGYAHHNNYDMALHYFRGMQREGLRPNDATFMSLLSACSHKGLLNEACNHFKAMKDKYGIIPTVDHCNCMVDLLAREGCLKQAEELLESLPYKYNMTGWTTLLTQCRVHNELEVGRRCFDHLADIDRTFASGYIQMSNLYAGAGLPKEAETLEEQRKTAHAWKKPGRSFIEVDDTVHDFAVGDDNHPRISDVYTKLRSLGAEMKKKGILPHLHAVLKQMSDEEKEDYLCGHCEKLAIAFGLISTPPGTPIRVAKNLRVCIDCHSATKAISELEGREIIVIDPYRVHHFKAGSCSCNDYF